MARMKRPSYRAAIEWIASNDDAGSPDALVPEIVGNYVSSCLVADLFGVEQSRVGLDVVLFRLARMPRPYLVSVYSSKRGEAVRLMDLTPGKEYKVTVSGGGQRLEETAP